MKYLKHIIFSYTILLLFSSCTKKIETTSNLVNVKTLTAKENIVYSIEKNFSLKKYIMLQDDRNNLLSTIDKVKIKGGKIYIMDKSGPHQVFIFDMNGNFIREIGKRGKGPGEHTMLCDFDVDDNGKIYLYSRQQKKIFIYDSDNSFIKEHKLSFFADGFNLLKNGKYIFSVLKENNIKRKDIHKKHPKVLITDSLFNIEKTYFSYNNNCLDNKGNTNLFSEFSDGLLYNKPVNDTIFLFDWEGNLKQGYYINFGEKTLPNNFKNDYTLYSQEKDKSFWYMYQTPLIFSSNIIGNIYMGRNKGLFLYDISNNEFQVEEYSVKDFNHTKAIIPLYTLNDSTIISYMDYEIYSATSEKELLSEDMKKHLENGGYVITVFVFN